jgi:hypothetical protein
MKLKKDILLDIIYSIPFGIVLLMESPELEKLNGGIILIFKNLILISLLILWVKSISKSQPSGLLIVTSLTKKSSISSNLTLLKEFIEIKLYSFVVIFCCYSFFSDSIDLSDLPFYVIQILAVGFYTLSGILISYAYAKISVNHFAFAFFLIGPYLILFLVQGIFSINGSLLFALIPSNLTLFLKEGFSGAINIATLVCSFISFFMMMLYSSKAIDKLLRGPKYYNLQNEKAN